jgi:uncharacterized phage-like protein YoqJ
MKIAVTGHRPQKIGSGWNDKVAHMNVKHRMKRFFKEEEPELIITGMALGVDMWAAEIADVLSIPFIAAVPFMCQDVKWTPEVRQRYHRYLNRAAKVFYIDRTPGYISTDVSPDAYHPAKMLQRNKWMVDQLGDGDILYAVIKSGYYRGGTAQCLEYAEPLMESRGFTVVRDTLKNYNPLDDLPF